MRTHADRGAARDRLLSTTADTIYRRGITASGVDEIVSRSSVSKPTLYAHFHSKAELVTAALEATHRRRSTEVEAYLADVSARGEQRVLALFDWLASYQESADCRGCAFLNAAVELVGSEYEPARRVVSRHKRWWRSVFEEAAAQAGIAEAARLGDMLLLLFDGANARVLVEHDTWPVAVARRAAETLIRTHQGRAS